LGWLKVNNLDSQGHYSGGVTNEHLYTTPSHGTTDATGEIYPAFVSLAATFLTQAPRGRASRGRISLPFALSGANRASSIVDPTRQLAVANAVEDLLGVLWDTGQPEGNFVPSVYSSVDGSFSEIHQVRVGRRFDTINRRKNAVDEAPYSTVPFLPT
jgi:hypothetical protein